MKIIIDTNRIIASLIKDGISRKIIFNKNFEFISPDYSFLEIYNHEREIRKKAKLSHEEFELVLALLFEKIIIFPEEDYKKYLEEAKNLIKDSNDVPFVAVYLFTRAEGIWSDDAHFVNSSNLRIFRTKEMMNLSIL
jgi:predicted nucleic acid-binding protein